MDEFYWGDIPESDQIKIIKIRDVMPKNIRDVILIEDIQNLLKINIEELDTQITILFSRLGLNASTQTREAIKKIIYPEQTTKINNNNITTTSINERKYIDQIKSILFDAKIEVDDNTASNLLKADEDTRRAVLNSIFDSDNIKLNTNQLQKILQDITNIANNYQLSLVKNLLKPETGSLVQDYISDEKYATNPEIVKLVSDKFKEIFNCQTGLSEQNVKDLLMIKYRQRNSVLSTIIEQKKLKPILFGRDKFEMNELSFLLFICNLVSDFNKGNNNNKGNTQIDIIFSDQAVKRITDYFVGEYKNNKLIIDFTNAVILDENKKIDKEILDNKMSRFSFTQINKMLNDGVLPERLLAIKNFDIYIKYQYLANDMMNADILKSLCEQFIDFLYMDITTGHLDKQDNKNIVTPDFVQTLITKYITEKKLNDIIEINKDPVIYRLFFNKNDVLRDKQAINKLLGTDEQILEIFMNAKVDLALLMDIINLPIKLDFSDAWLNKIKSNNSYNDYNEFLGDLIAEKKLKTFTLEDMSEDKNKIVKNKNKEDEKETIKNLLGGREIRYGKEKFQLNEKQISQTKVIKVIAQDLNIIKGYLDKNKDKDITKSTELEKLFAHLFWFTNPIDQDFFSQLVTFLQKEILADFTEDGNINDIVSVNELKKILQNKTLVYLFQNIESDFVMSVLLNQLLGNYLQIGNWTAQEYANVFIAFFESIKDNKNFSLGQFKNVFIKTFVAKTKDMNRHGMFAEGTVLAFVLREIKNINSLLQEEYKFEDTSYFDVCLGKLNIDPNDLSEEKDINANVIHDPDQENMDNLIFDFFRSKFNLYKDIKNEIVDSNKSNNENKNRINIESKNTVKNNEIKKETDQKKEKTSDNKGNFISDGDFLTDEAFDEMFGSGKEINNQNKKQHVLTEKDKKDGDQEKIKTKEIKLECIADLYDIDKEIVEEIINLNQNNSNVSRFVADLGLILNDNEHQNQKVKDSIKKCYIDQFFFCKTFTKIALMMHDKTQKDRDENVIDYESNYKKLFKKLFDKQEDIDCNIKNVFDEKDINYFWTVWEKRYAYFKNKINLCQINFEIDNDVDDADQEYEQKYLEGIMKAKKKYNLDKEILKSKNNVELGKYNLHADIIKEIDLQVKSSCTASFETFFFGYLSVLKKTVTEVNAEFKKENLSDFQKCYIQEFLMWHRNNENAKSIKKPFLLDMYFFFNKGKDSGKPQNIFGKEVMDYFLSCMTNWFIKKPKAINLKFDKKLEPLKSSILNEIQIIEMDQQENLGSWFLAYLDPEKTARERQNRIEAAKKLISNQQNVPKNQKKQKVVLFNPKIMRSRLIHNEPKEDKKIEESNSDINKIKINNDKKYAGPENKGEHGEKINLNENDNNREDKKLDENNVSNNDKNLIKNEIQEKKEETTITKIKGLFFKSDNKERRSSVDYSKTTGTNPLLRSYSFDENNKIKIENNINDNDKNLIKDESQKKTLEINNKIKTNNLDDKREKNEITDTNNSNITNDVQIPIEHENTVKKMDIKNNNLQDDQKENDIDNNKLEKTIKHKDNQNIGLNKKNNIEDMNNDVKKRTEILTDNEKLETKTKGKSFQDNLNINNDTSKNLKNNNIIINNHEGKEDKNNEFEENNLRSPADLISTKNNLELESGKNINFKQPQNSSTIKINCLPDKNNINEHTKYMSILYGLDTKIINEINIAISNLRFTQNFNFSLPLNQIFNKYGKKQERQIKQYYMDCFFDSNIFKTHMQEETFESMFRRYFTDKFLSRESVFDNDDINYFWGQWKKTVLLHFDSQQFKNQKLNVNQNFCFETNYSPSKSHNISLELVNKINSSIENLEYYKPEDFFRGYHMLFEQENKTLINKDNKLGIQKYYIESFLMHYMQKDNIDTKFLRHVNFRFRGYLLKKQTIFDDEAVKYFYELLEKLLLVNKENEIVKNEVSDGINGHKIKNFEVNITGDFITIQEKKRAEENCRNYKIAFWVLIVLAVLSGGAIYFSAYFAIPLVIAFGCNIFCFIKKRKYDRKISDLVGSEKCLLPEYQIESYKNSVKDNVICDIDYFAEIQENEKNMYNYILNNRNNMFGVALNCKDKIKNEKE